MSFQVPTTAIVSYRNNVELALQQKVTVLSHLAGQQDCTGERAEITNLIGMARGNRANVRHGPTIIANTPHDRRWMMKPEEYYIAELVDNADRLKAGIDLQGGYVMNGAATINRGYDEAFLLGFYGTAYTGKDGATQVTFPAGNIIPVTQGAAAPTGMNVAKLRAARAQLVRNLVDIQSDELYITLTSQQTDNLLNEVQATSEDFIKSNGGMSVTMTGKLSKLFGFNIVECEIGNTASFPEAAPLTLDASLYRRVPFWVKSGMQMGWWQRSNTSIDKRPDLQMAVQVWAGTTVAASRTQEGKCGQILCLEV